MVRSRALFFPLLLIAAAACAQQTPIHIAADLTDAPRKFFHAEMDLPVHAGPLALTEAEWIPGHHAPKSVDNDIAGLAFTANGQTLAWQRDDVDLYQFHLTIPAGVTTLHKARLAPGEKILAVNGRVFSSDALRAAVHDSKTASGPLALIIQNDTHVATIAIDYHDGERYPALVRVDGTPGYLDEIAKPLTPAPPPAAQ